MVVARSILAIAYPMLAKGTTYVELGADYFDELNQAQVERRLLYRLTQFGYKVTLEPLPT